MCYLVPQELPEVKGLRVLRAGLELGAVLKNRFEPAHAWALWLQTLENSVSFEEELAGHGEADGLGKEILVKVHAAVRQARLDACTG